MGKPSREKKTINPRDIWAEEKHLVPILSQTSQHSVFTHYKCGVKHQMKYTNNHHCFLPLIMSEMHLMCDERMLIKVA